MLTLIFPVLAVPLISLLTTAPSWLSTSCSIFALSFLSLLFLSPFSFSFSAFSSFMCLDSISLPLITLTLWISGLMLLASYQFLTDKDRPRAFLMTATLLMTSLILFFSTSHLILFYVFFEASLIPTLFLILLWGVQPERLQASMYLMLYTVAASLPLLISLFLIFYTNGSMFMNFLLWGSPVNDLMISVWWVVTIMAFLVKMPIFSLHLWLPKAHVEAPLAGSMVLAAILLKLGSYGLIRLTSLFPLASLKVLSPFASLCLLGACVTGAICVRQTDMKALIAYSSIGHMGLLTAAIFASTKWGWEGALVMMIAHGLSSSSMFCMANSSYELTHTRSLYITKGLLSLFPSMALLWFMACAANMSAPPSINLMGEILLLAPITASSLLFIPFLILACLLTGAYTLVLFSSTQHGHPSNFLSPLLNSSPRNFLLLTLHILPLFLLILLSNLITISL